METFLMKKPNAVLVCVTCFALQAVTDVKSLIRKNAIAQRVPFYEPDGCKTIPTTCAVEEITILAHRPRQRNVSA